MKEEIINKIPNSWSEIKLRKGKQLFCLDVKSMTENEYIAEAYRILTNEDPALLSGNEILQAKERILNLLNSPINNKLKYEFDVNGRKLYLQYDIANATWVEFTHLERALEQSQSNVWQHIEKVLGILIREKEEEIKQPKKKAIQLFKSKRKKEYEAAVKKVEDEVLLNYSLKPYEYGIEYMKRCEVILDSLSVDDVQAVVFFCLNVGIKFTNSLAGYLHPVLPVKQSIQGTGQTLIKTSGGLQ